MNIRQILLRGVAIAIMGLLSSLARPDEALALACTACGAHADCEEGGIFCPISCGSGTCDTGCERVSEDCNGHSKFTCAAC